MNFEYNLMKDIVIHHYKKLKFIIQNRIYKKNLKHFSMVLNNFVREMLIDSLIIIVSIGDLVMSEYDFIGDKCFIAREFFAYHYNKDTYTKMKLRKLNKKLHKEENYVSFNEIYTLANW